MSSTELTSEHVSPLIYNTVEQLVFNKNSEIAKNASEILDFIGNED